MLERLTPAPPDKIIRLMTMFRDDPRPDRIDLGIGVYRNRDGVTPIMRAVRVAEELLHQRQTTKSYVGLAGDASFCDGMAGLVIDNAADRRRLRVAQTPGGAGALSILARLANQANPGARVWIPDPTWVNHAGLLAAEGLKVKTYPFVPAPDGRVAIDPIMDILCKVEKDDLVLLHGCCHNPTGARIDGACWRSIAQSFARTGAVPFIDFAYQGFGQGLDADAAGVRLLAGSVPEMMVAASCSKNFGVYRDRVGCAMLLCESSPGADAAFSRLLSISRLAYSMPPDHGAACVGLILADPALNKEWRAELDEMRERIAGLRMAIASAFARAGKPHYDFLASQEGMFSTLPLTPPEVELLRTRHGIYAVADGRINVAGLREDQVARFVLAATSVLE